MSCSGGNTAKLQLFLTISTCFLYLVAAGLFSKAVWYFENHAWNTLVGGDASEVGSGPGSYDIRQSVWHVNCCNPELNGGGGWGIFNSILGWTNSATYGSVLAYNFYWIAVMVAFALMSFQEREGRMPFMRAKEASDEGSSEIESQNGEVLEHSAVTKKDGDEMAQAAATVRELNE